MSLSIPVKVCGLTRVADLRLALRLGATYVGTVVEIGRSPRSVSREAARQLMRCALGRGVIVTELQDPGHLADLAGYCAPSAVQVHGSPAPELLAALARELGPGTAVWAALGMPADRAQASRALPGLIDLARAYAAAGAARVVLDSRVGAHSGGTGMPLNWELAAEVIGPCPVPVMLAGGITPENARRALEVSGAAGLDVSSGVEARPGVKCPRRVQALLEAVCAGPHGD